jgi:hypothetical protein
MKRAILILMVLSGCNSTEKKDIEFLKTEYKKSLITQQQLTSAISKLTKDVEELKSSQIHNKKK